MFQQCCVNLFLRYLLIKASFTHKILFNVHGLTRLLRCLCSPSLCGFLNSLLYLRCLLFISSCLTRVLSTDWEHILQVQVLGAGTKVIPVNSKGTCTICFVLSYVVGDMSCSLYSKFSTGPQTHLLPQTPYYVQGLVRLHRLVTFLTFCIYKFPVTVRQMENLDA